MLLLYRLVSCCFLGYAIIQLPELCACTFHIVKKRLFRVSTVDSTRDNDNVHSSKSSDFIAVPTFTTITRGNEYNTNVQFVKLMTMIDQKMDQKIHKATQEILDLMSNRFDALQSK